MTIPDDGALVDWKRNGERGSRVGRVEGRTPSGRVRIFDFASGRRIAVTTPALVRPHVCGSWCRHP